MKLRLAIAIIGSTLLFAAPAWADSWDFTNPSGPVGSNTQVYTGGGTLTVEALGFNSDLSPAELYGKTSGPGETGLGIDNDRLENNEISSADFINLNMKDLVNHGIFGATLDIGSVQFGESFKICQGGSASAFGTVGCATFTGSSNSSAVMTEHLSWTAATDVISVTAVNRDVLIGTLTNDQPSPSSVPEPTSLLLLGSGLLGIGTKLRRSRG